MRTAPQGERPLRQIISTGPGTITAEDAELAELSLGELLERLAADTDGQLQVRIDDTGTALPSVLLSGVIAAVIELSNRRGSRVLLRQLRRLAGPTPSAGIRPRATVLGPAYRQIFQATGLIDGGEGDSWSMDPLVAACLRRLIVCDDGNTPQLVNPVYAPGAEPALAA
jgi:hypothetical protein